MPLSDIGAPEVFPCDSLETSIASFFRFSISDIPLAVSFTSSVMFFRPVCLRLGEISSAFASPVAELILLSLAITPDIFESLLLLRVAPFGGVVEFYFLNASDYYCS